MCQTKADHFGIMSVTEPRFPTLPQTAYRSLILRVARSTAITLTFNKSFGHLERSVEKSKSRNKVKIGIFGALGKK